jgi:hypothetical protein
MERKIFAVVLFLAGSTDVADLHRYEGVSLW